MKKTTIPVLAFCLFMSTAFISCKKDYTCKCTVNVNFLGTASSSDTTYVIPKTTKKKAKNTCNQSGTDLNSQAALLGGNASCTLN